MGACQVVGGLPFGVVLKQAIQGTLKRHTPILCALLGFGSLLNSPTSELSVRR